MCIRVQYAPLDSCHTLYDDTARVITLPRGLTRCQTIRALRAVLEELAITQPPIGALCWCGAQVPVLPRVPHQRSGQVRHGA